MHVVTITMGQHKGPGYASGLAWAALLAGGTTLAVSPGLRRDVHDFFEGKSYTERVEADYSGYASKRPHLVSHLRSYFQTYRNGGVRKRELERMEELFGTDITLRAFVDSQYPEGVPLPTDVEFDRLVEHLTMTGRLEKGDYTPEELRRRLFRKATHPDALRSMGAKGYVAAFGLSLAQQFTPNDYERYVGYLQETGADRDVVRIYGRVPTQRELRDAMNGIAIDHSKARVVRPPGEEKRTLQTGPNTWLTTTDADPTGWYDERERQLLQDRRDAQINENLESVPEPLRSGINRAREAAERADIQGMMEDIYRIQQGKRGKSAEADEVLNSLAASREAAEEAARRLLKGLNGRQRNQ